MRVGDIEFEVISGGAFKLDGGGMFGDLFLDKHEIILNQDLGPSAPTELSVN